MDSTAKAPPTPSGTSSRRRFLYGGVAAAAAAAGAGLAWWKYAPTQAPSNALDSFWSTSFQTPQGAALPMAAFRGKPLLINFWATWCPPCVEELPMIDAFYRQHAGNGWQVVGLALDQPSAVRSFLLRTPVTFPVGLGGLEGTELGRSLGNASGALPFSVVVSAVGGVLHRRMGRLTAGELAEWARQA
ncbi:TlpA disulfide reductase family protein [Caenimonas terrae]|uniref:TlpA disulfide reductase family protein n=1 Tax=Caenimonas terrae TaxID=696074 RepID=A0ABW0NFC4_9BURK